MPSISIIVPVFNAEKYLKECIDSILHQTFDDFELLLINDGSSDKSGAICDDYEKKDSRIKAIHKENSGVASTRNFGLSRAASEYILFIDADDYINPNTLQLLYSKATINNSDIVMCGYLIVHNEKAAAVQMDYRDCYIGKDTITKELLYLYYTNYHVGLYSLWNKLIRKSIYSTNKIFFDESLKRGEDAWFIFECLKHSQRIDYISTPLYYYRQNEKSIMHSHYDDQYDQWVNIRKRLLEENKFLNLKIDYNLFYSDFLYKVILYCRECIQIGESQKAKDILKDKFYRSVCKYNVILPVHIRLIIYASLLNVDIAFEFLKFWSKK